MNAKERYLAVLDDNERNKLDRVPTFVQYIRPEFVELHKHKFENIRVPFKSKWSRFTDAYAMGFESVFAIVPQGFKVRAVKVKDEKGENVYVAWNGQPPKLGGYYERGLFFSFENFDKVRESLRKVDESAQIKKVMNQYTKISPHIYPVIQIGGIFDTLWQSMGFKNFSYHYRKNTKLYQELIKYFAKLTRIQVESIIEATGNLAGVLNINDDIAFKGRSMISPERWEKNIGNYYKEICSIIKDAGMKITLHSDGDVTEMIPILKKLGFMGVQGWEGGADPFNVNKEHPDFVVIGFGDVSQVLPFGSKEDIFSHVKELMDALKENRHFIIGPSTVIYEGMPYKNVEYFVKASKYYGKY